MANDIDKKLTEVLNAYKQKFGEKLFYAEDLPMPPIEVWIEELQKCIVSGTPYVYPESDLPEGCIS